MTNFADLDNLEFRTVKETWNEYEFNNGTKLRGRMFLTRIAEEKNAPRPESKKPGELSQDLKFSFAKHFEVFAPKDQLGAPSVIPSVNDIPDKDKIEVDPMTMSEPWNTYEIIKNGTVVKAKLIVSEIFKVNGLFDRFGQPYYIIKNGPMFDTKPNLDANRFA